MTTTPKTTRTPRKGAAQPPAAPESVQEYRMPAAVAEWIEQAESRLRYQAGEIERLKETNARLKREHIQMQHRVLGTSRE